MSKKSKDTYLINELPKEGRKTLNDLARHQMILKLEADILMDMQTCDIEGWDKTEYIRLVGDLLDKLRSKIGEIHDK